MIRLLPLLLLTFMCSAESSDGTAGSAEEAFSAAVEIREWEVPYADSRPRDPFVAPDGRVWFVGQRSHYAAVLDPESGEFRRYDLPEGAGPHNLIVDGDGIVWYAGNLVGNIGRLDPATGEVQVFRTLVRDPHTLVFAPDGTIWFTAQQGNRVGHFVPETGLVRLIEVPTPSARPYGIVLDGSGRVWVAEFGTNKIGVTDTASMAYREIELPRAETRPRRVVVTPDGMVWYVDYAQGMLGRLDPETETVQEWPAPAGAGSHPYAMAADSAGRIWFVETGPQPNRFVGFEPASETFSEPVAITSGGGSVRHMHFDQATNAIWFGTDTNTIGRAQLP